MSKHQFLDLFTEAVKQRLADYDLESVPAALVSAAFSLYTKDLPEDLPIREFKDAGHANVNFKSLTGEKAAALIEQLEESKKYYKKDEEGNTYLLFDNNDDTSYITVGNYIYIRKATYDRRVFLAIGEIVNTILKDA